MSRIVFAAFAAVSLAALALAAGERELDGSVTVDGKPAEGAVVTAVVKSRPDGKFTMLTHEGKTGADGKFVMPNALPAVGGWFGAWIATVAPGGALQAPYLESDTGVFADDFTLDLTPGHPVTLRFLDDGKPAANVEVYPAARFTKDAALHSVHGNAAYPFTQRTDAKGELAVTWFEAGDRATVRVRYPGPGWTARGFTVVGDEHETFTFEKTPLPKASAEHVVPDKEGMEYFQFGPKHRDPAPDAGYALVLVLPGGSGNAEFRAWCEERYQDWVGAGVVMAELVAKKWTPEQQIIWPTEKSKVDKMKFTTEEFVASVVEDLSSRVKIDPRRVITVSWSSSGPACYRIHTLRRTPVTASLVVMSVFKQDQMDSKRIGKKRPRFILHSPEDKTCNYIFVERARKWFGKKSTNIATDTYAGGHGWAGMSVDKARKALHWLQTELRD